VTNCQKTATAWLKIDVANGLEAPIHVIRDHLAQALAVAGQQLLAGPAVPPAARSSSKSVSGSRVVGMVRTLYY